MTLEMKFGWGLPYCGWMHTEPYAKDGRQDDFPPGPTSTGLGIRATVRVARLFFMDHQACVLVNPDYKISRSFKYPEKYIKV